jgi:hypothetical protein
MRTTSCENTFSVCNRSSSSRPGSLRRHRRRHHGGGEMCSRRTPSQHPTTQRRIAVPHLHFLRAPPSPRARSPKALHGVSTSTICAKGIVNITHLARLLVEIHFTRRQISRSRKTKLAPSFVRILRNILLAAIATYCYSFTEGGLWSVGGSLLGFRCWPGAAFGSSGYMHILLARKKTFISHYRDLRKSHELLFDCIQSLFEHTCYPVIQDTTPLVRFASSLGKLLLVVQNLLPDTNLHD